MKSQTITQNLLRITKALFEDIALAYPDLTRDMERDLITIESQVGARGLGFFTLDLPELDRYLTQSLAVGRQCCDIPKPFRKESVEGTTFWRPRLLRGLWDIVFPSTNNCEVTSDASASTAIFFLRQVFCLGKKIEIECSDKRTEQAILDYIFIEEQMVEPFFTEDQIENLFKRPIRPGDFLTKLLGDFPDEEDHLIISRWFYKAREVFSSLGNFSGWPTEWVAGDKSKVRKARHGPGAVADLKSGADKYLFPNWPSRLERLYPFHVWGVHNLNPFLEEDIQPPSEDAPSRLIAVPKTAKAPRLIAAEPTAAMWCQQHLGDILYHRCVDRGLTSIVDWRDQGPSRDLARRGSLSGDYCTIDLSSASDRLPLRYMEVALSGNLNLLDAFHAVRTTHVDIDVCGVQKRIKLRKFATQGTALTFPLQSLFFMSVLYAVSDSPTLRQFTWREDVRVFGDDLLCPNEWYEDVTRLLALLGLKVNLDKSFNTGNFRESCGMDAWLGHDVTPLKPRVVNVSSDPASVAALIDTTNNFFMKGLWRTAKAVECELEKEAACLPIVGTGVGTTGLFSFCGSKYDHLKTRWNDKLQRYEFLSLAVTAKVKVKDSIERSRLLQYFTEEPKPDTPWVSGLRGRPSLRKQKGWSPLPG